MKDSDEKLRECMDTIQRIAQRHFNQEIERRIKEKKKMLEKKDAEMEEVKLEKKDVEMEEVRCKNCGKKLGVISGKAKIKCPRCGHINYIDTEEVHETQPK